MKNAAAVVFLGQLFGLVVETGAAQRNLCSQCKIPTLTLPQFPTTTPKLRFRYTFGLMLASIPVPA